MASEAQVYVVDDDDAVRRSIRFMLQTKGQSVQTFDNGENFLKAVATLEPGCILLDVRMPGMDGLEVQKALRDQGCAFPVIIMTGHGDVTVAVDAMKGGAIDFIEKPFDQATLLSAISTAHNRLNTRPAFDDRSLIAKTRLQVLTPREQEVLDGLAKGQPNKTIAYDLGISPRTVEIHRANLMEKLQVKSFSEALRIAFAAGLGEEGSCA